MEKPTFEIALEQLQQTVKRLEAGDIGLEEALKCFEEGVRLTRLCQEQLTVAEQKVDILLKSSLTNPEAPVETQSFTSGR